jgi:ABC-type transport system involved in multi-copper enzyme maturation permease subunit
VGDRLRALLQKEARQITRSRRTVVAALTVPILMLVVVTLGDILALRIGFGAHPIYLLSSARSVTPETLLRHFSLPILVTISSLVTPSILMGDVLLGERERRTLELLVALPITALDVVVAKLVAVLGFALSVTIPVFLLNVVMVSLFGYATPGQEFALGALLLSAVLYSAGSGLLVALLAGEPRAANIVSGLVLGPVVPVEGLILTTVSGDVAVVLSFVVLAALAALVLLWSLYSASFERLVGAL